MKKRVFAAIDISAEARRKTAAYINFLRQKFPNVRAGWDKPEKLHLTLKFLGDADEIQLERLITAAQKTANNFAPFKLRISGTGVFPSPRQAKVLWLGVTGEEDKLNELNLNLENECAASGFEREKRNFKAHLTIARLKEKSDKLVETHLQQTFEPIEFDVSEMVIYESTLHPTGSVYLVISRNQFENEIG